MFFKTIPTYFKDASKEGITSTADREDVLDVAFSAVARVHVFLKHLEPEQLGDGAGNGGFRDACVAVDLGYPAFLFTAIHGEEHDGVDDQELIQGDGARDVSGDKLEQCPGDLIATDSFRMCKLFRMCNLFRVRFFH